MWPFSGAARNELAQSHTAVSRLDVLVGGRPAYTMVVSAGTVNTQTGRSVLRNMGATIVDASGALSGSNVNDVLNPYSCEVAVYRGVQLPSGVKEWAPQGVFVLTSRSVTGSGDVQIEGQDRAIRYQGAMQGSLAISAGTKVEQAIITLLATRNPGVQMQDLVTGYTVGPLLYAPDIDVWKEAQTLAESVGGYLYHDRRGLLVFGYQLPLTAHPTRAYVEGDGLLLDVSRAENSDSINNVVVVQQQAGSNIRAVAMDTNPSSPTYAGGKYGRHVFTVTNANIQSIAQATTAARNELVNQLGRSETVTLTVVPDPTQDVMEAIMVNRPRAGLNNATLIVDSTTLPLGVTDNMSIGCRKFILTEDGQVLQQPLTVSTS